MHRDAVKRVNEMHKRSQQIVGASPIAEKSDKDNKPPLSEEKERPSNKSDKTISDQASENLSGSVFGQTAGLGELAKLWNFKVDEEKALIGIIIYILAKNNADPKLLIGLGYLLL